MWRTRDPLVVSLAALVLFLELVRQHPAMLGRGDRCTMRHAFRRADAPQRAAGTCAAAAAVGEADLGSDLAHFNQG